MPTPTPTNAPSGTPTTAPSGTPTTAPSGTPTTAPSGTPTTAPTGTPIATATPTPVPTATPTTAPANTLTIDQPTVTLCAPLQGNTGEATYGCANSGTGVSVHTAGVTGQLTATSQTGIATATVVTGSGAGFPAVSIGITAAPSGGGFLTGTDTITIRDSGTGNVATVPVTVVAGGTDGTGFVTGAGYFELLAGAQGCVGSSGTLTPFTNSTGSAISAVSNNANIATIAPSGGGFSYSFLTAGSTYFTLTAGTNTEIVPVNVQAHVPAANSC